MLDGEICALAEYLFSHKETEEETLVKLTSCRKIGLELLQSTPLEHIVFFQNLLLICNLCIANIEARDENTSSILN